MSPELATQQTRVIIDGTEQLGSFYQHYPTIAGLFDNQTIGEAEIQLEHIAKIEVFPIPSDCIFLTVTVVFHFNPPLDNSGFIIENIVIQGNVLSGKTYLGFNLDESFYIESQMVEYSPEVDEDSSLPHDLLDELERIGRDIFVYRFCQCSS